MQIFITVSVSPAVFSFMQKTKENIFFYAEPQYKQVIIFCLGTLYPSRQVWSWHSKMLFFFVALHNLFSFKTPLSFFSFSRMFLKIFTAKVLQRIIYACCFIQMLHWECIYCHSEDHTTSDAQPFIVLQNKQYLNNFKIPYLLT